jgi:hypothetical protein
VEQSGSDSERPLVRSDQHEGNHGEGAKEYYFYLDNTPTHSFMEYLYKYPQQNILNLSLRGGGRHAEN